jgi:6-pyruvoyltetrahydropterin/6-carboxytetrahydropterin synthase
MPVIRVTKQFSFEMAHALWNYDGACKNIHGHSYLLSVTVTGTPVPDPEDPKYGMVIDFSVLKKIVKENIIAELDHALLISSHSKPDELNAGMQMFSKLNLVPFQPTCENLLSYIAERLTLLLPETAKLHSLTLRETPTSYAEWHASDNTR